MTRDQMIEATVALHEAEHKHQMRSGRPVYSLLAIEATIDGGLTIGETIIIAERQLRAKVLSDSVVSYEASSDNGQTWRDAVLKADMMSTARDKALIGKALNASRARLISVVA